MRALFSWLRRTLAFSTTRSAWNERAAAFGLLAVGIGGWWLSRDWLIEGRVLLLGLWLAVTCLLLRAEIIHLLGPVFSFEILRGSRRRVHASRVIYTTLLLASVVYIYLLDSNRYVVAEVKRQSEAANTIFQTFFGIQMLLVAVLTPVMVAGCISEEKERRTLEFVLATDLRGREIVLGKLAARLAGMFLLVLAGLPVFSFLQFLG